MRICHITSAHPRYDARIFTKQCQGLARAGHEVHLVVADGKGDEVRDGVSIHDVGRRTGRLGRMVFAARAAVAAARGIAADVYQMHDPELLLHAGMLKGRSRTVIFDAHEDVPQQLKHKPYLPGPTAPVASLLFRGIEWPLLRRLDGVICATDHIRDRIAAINTRCIAVKNFPLVESGLVTKGRRSGLDVCYVGRISTTRGIRHLLEAFALVKSGARLHVAGTFESPALERELRAMPSWQRVNYLGTLDRKGVHEVYSTCSVGMVTLLPTPAHLDALPVKLFEYMSAGIPVISSDIPLWRGIVEDARCGVCVDPEDPQAIAEAIDRLVLDLDSAEEMGRNGMRAVSERYNWDAEGRRLADFYESFRRG